MDIDARPVSQVNCLGRETGRLVTRVPVEQPFFGVDVVTPDVDEEVIPILRVENAEAAVAWYERPGFVRE